MPTGRTITAKEAGILLPGTRVEINAHATVILPTKAEIERDGGDVPTHIYVRFDDGTYAWLPRAACRHIG